MSKKYFFPLLFLPLILLFVAQSQPPEDTFIVVGGGPPGLALYENGQYVGATPLGDAWPGYTMYDAFLWGDKLVVTTAEVGRWILIYHLPDLSKPATAIKAPGNVSHFLYYTPEVAPLSGNVLYIAVFNQSAKRGYICRLDLEQEVLSDCIDVGVYPHAPVKYGGYIVTPLIREPYLVKLDGGGVTVRVRVEMPWRPYVNPHDPLRYTWLSFHMITTDGKYIYGEGHAIDPGYMLAVEVHAHSYIVSLDGGGRVVAFYPTSALPPGLPGLAVCRGRLFATSPLEGLVYVLSTPDLKPLAILKVGETPWGVFANPDCSRVYVTDILGGRVYVIDVGSLETVKVFKTPMRWPHTVIFVNGDAATIFKQIVQPLDTIPITGDLPPPVVACGDLPP
ncbi:hypothetical protein Pogu_1384 [Pyrobaculum oguniense TE7]|uniref:YncE family protein n=1 Tax=Pyrobaculum oguniense (strain DSM 13380 / JCM 10595 / TE7) TaxID=698757 RepID=H6Q930_PYROT|nr:hypothetical protein Pogu_1384 [Pyrobaculum oguniense TE7]